MHLMPEREVPGSSSAYLSRVSVSLQAGRDAAREKGQPEIVWAASLHLLSPPQSPRGFVARSRARSAQEGPCQAPVTADGPEGAPCLGTPSTRNPVVLREGMEWPAAQYARGSERWQIYCPGTRSNLRLIAGSNHETHKVLAKVSTAAECCWDTAP